MKAVGFTFDPSRCIKCWSCEIACREWNGIPATEPGRRRVFELVSGSFPAVDRLFVSLGCLHCEDPQCVRTCPTSAVHVRAEDGAVVVDKAKCIECHFCARACPYGIPQFVNGAMDKCDLCSHADPSLGEPAGKPHCVAACLTHALGFTDDPTLLGQYPNFAAEVVDRIARDPESLVW